MYADTIQRTIVLESTDCINCGVIFAMPQELLRSYRRNGKTFHCPNGHGMSYTETEAMKLKKELAQEQARLANAEMELIATRRAHEEQTKKITKLERRVKNGACPCCKRQFVNVTRHMQSQHPDYAEAKK